MAGQCHDGKFVGGLGCLLYTSRCVEETGLNGIYDVMRSTNYYSGRMIYYGDVTGDDAQSIKTGKRTTCLLYTS